MVELLVAALLASLILGSGLALLRAQAAVARRLQAKLAALGAAGWALEIAARDLELAGADPQGIGVAAIVAAGHDRVDLASDHDGDGVLDASSAERIRLSWSSASGGRLLRRLGNQSMSIASPVPAAGLRLRYLDARGVDLAASPMAELDAAACASVRQVSLDLTVREPVGDAAESITLTTRAALRARAGRP